MPVWAYAYLQVLGDAVNATKSLDDGKIARSRVEQIYNVGSRRQIVRSYEVLGDDPTRDEQVWNVQHLPHTGDVSFGPYHYLGSKAEQAFRAVGEDTMVSDMLGCLAAHGALEPIREELDAALDAI